MRYEVKVGAERIRRTVKDTGFGLHLVCFRAQRIHSTRGLGVGELEIGDWKIGRLYGWVVGRLYGWRVEGWKAARLKSWALEGWKAGHTQWCAGWFLRRGHDFAHSGGAVA